LSATHSLNTICSAHKWWIRSNTGDHSEIPSNSLEALIYIGTLHTVAERGKCTNTHYFFFVNLADPSPHLLYKVCFSEFQCFFECFFVLWSWLLESTVPTTSAYLPINLRTFKSQSKMLCLQVFTWRNICEKLPKAVSLTSVHITFNIIIGIGADKASAQNYRTFGQSIHFPWSQTPTEVSTQPPEWHNLPPSAPSLTDSNAFRPWFLNSEKFEPSEMDPWYFCHMPTPPCLHPELMHPKLNSFLLQKYCKNYLIHLPDMLLHGTNQTKSSPLLPSIEACLRNPHPHRRKICHAKGLRKQICATSYHLAIQNWSTPWSGRAR